LLGPGGKRYLGWEGVTSQYGRQTENKFPGTPETFWETELLPAHDCP